jgi:hypothetical protein
MSFHYKIHIHSLTIRLHSNNNNRSKFDSLLCKKKLCNSKKSSQLPVCNKLCIVNSVTKNLSKHLLINFVYKECSIAFYLQQQM